MCSLECQGESLRDSLSEDLWCRSAALDLAPTGSPWHIISYYLGNLLPTCLQLAYKCTQINKIKFKWTKQKHKAAVWTGYESCRTAHPVAIGYEPQDKSPLAKGPKGPLPKEPFGSCPSVHPNRLLLLCMPCHADRKETEAQLDVTQLVEMSQEFPSLSLGFFTSVPDSSSTHTLLFSQVSRL